MQFEVRLKGRGEGKNTSATEKVNVASIPRVEDALQEIPSEYVFQPSSSFPGLYQCQANDLARQNDLDTITIN